MAYRTLCDRFGVYKTYPAALAGGAILFTTAVYTCGLSSHFSWSKILSASTMSIGAVGFCFAAVAEVGMKRNLKKKNIGITKGSNLVQKAQLTAYLGGCLLMAGLNLSTFNKAAQKSEPKPSTEEKASAPQQEVSSRSEGPKTIAPFS